MDTVASNGTGESGWQGTAASVAAKTLPSTALARKLEIGDVPVVSKVSLTVGGKAKTLKQTCAQALDERHVGSCRHQQDSEVRPRQRSPHCSSETCCIQSAARPSTASAMATWLIPVLGDAPCPCFTPGGIHATSPGWADEDGGRQGAGKTAHEASTGRVSGEACDEGHPFLPGE